MDLTGGVELRITGSSMLELMAQVAAGGLRCCKEPSAYALASQILEQEEQRVKNTTPRSSAAQATAAKPPADPSGPAAGETGQSAAPSEKAAAHAPEPAPKETPQPAPTTGKAPSLEDIRAKGIEAAKKYGQAAVKAILKEFNAANMTTLPEDKRAEFLAKLEGLGGGNA